MYNILFYLKVLYKTPDDNRYTSKCVALKIKLKDDVLKGTVCRIQMDRHY
jgi:hypothetical protein